MRLIAEDRQALLVAAKGPSPMMSTRQHLAAAAWTTALLVASPLSAAAESKEGSKTVPAKPTPQQVAWRDMEVGMFIHFAPNTCQDKEGTTCVAGNGGSDCIGVILVRPRAVK
jgi:hypothetical protein